MKGMRNPQQGDKTLPVRSRSYDGPEVKLICNIAAKGLLLAGKLSLTQQTAGKYLSKPRPNVAMSLESAEGCTVGNVVCSVVLKTSARPLRPTSESSARLMHVAINNATTA